MNGPGNDGGWANLRKAAVLSVVAYGVLAMLSVWFSEFEWNAVVVRFTSDQARLARIVTDTGRQAVRDRALEKITDPSTLASLILGWNAEWRYSAVAALRKLDDPLLLGRIAVEGRGRDVRIAAVERLSDQALLARLAIEDAECVVREAVVSRLVTLGMLPTPASELAAMSDLELRIAVVGAVKDQTLLRRWASDSPQAAIRRAAVAGIGDDAFLLERLVREPSAAVRETLVDTVRDPAMLQRVATTAYHKADRDRAARRLAGLSPPAAAVATAAHKDLNLQVTASGSTTDSEELRRLAVEGAFDVVRIAAARHLRDSPAQVAAALQADDPAVLRILLAGISDTNSLAQIAARASDRAMRLAAMIKGGSTSWESIFIAAAATERDLGDALAAVALFGGVQEDARSAVQQACLTLIRKGDESRIPEMAELLEGYGDTTLAEDYLNCGQPDLDAAGRAWAQKRGYDVGTGHGSNRARWGNGRQ